MPIYSDGEIDEAIDRLAADVTRRMAQPEFNDVELSALAERLHEMEAARRRGDGDAAPALARSAQPALEAYRPTNATSRAKAVLSELVVELAGPSVPPAT